MIIDALKGPVQYRHDPLGNLIGAVYADGKIDMRMPDAVGNLFKTPDKRDRKYGPAGQLLESRGPEGVTKYEYDPEGNLLRKLLPDATAWTYAWNGAGMLTKVVRPDGKVVEFGYDALGRRVWKKYGAKTTKWIWDGNVPVHEWVEVDPAALQAPPAQQEAIAWEAGLTARKHMLSQRTAQGPPLPETFGTKEAPITWVFEPESFAPLAKLTAAHRYGIVTDHLGTPTAMLDESGKRVWAADIGVYGDLRDVVGEKAACPFRWPGQYEDDETGLYYNRFRYYDPQAGEYVCQDPIGLEGGLQLAGYVDDPLQWIDPLGLAGASCGPGEAIVLGEGMGRVKAAVRALRSSGIKAKWYQAWSKNFPGRPLTPQELNAGLQRNERWLRTKIKQGYAIYDIGPDGRPVPSPFYQRADRSPHLNGVSS
jgi:RHS repeat-associated protein